MSVDFCLIFFKFGSVIHETALMLLEGSKTTGLSCFSAESAVMEHDSDAQEVLVYLNISMNSYNRQRRNTGNNEEIGGSDEMVVRASKILH